MGSGPPSSGGLRGARLITPLGHTKSPQMVCCVHTRNDLDSEEVHQPILNEYIIVIDIIKVHIPRPHLSMQQNSELLSAHLRRISLV